jgi:hypothetical protein
LGWTRRAFLARTGATAAGVLALGAAACSDGSDAEGDEDDGGNGGSPEADPTPGDGVNDAFVPTTAAIYAHVEEVFGHGIRRPGYDADIWAEEWIADQFKDLGLENVRLEPVPVRRWEPVEWKFEVTPTGGATKELECFPVPFAVPVENLEIELAAFDQANPGAVAGKAALYDVTILNVPADIFVPAADRDQRVHDPDGTLTETHVLPFGSSLGNEIDLAVDAGAAAFIGALKGYPTDTFDYYVPYHGLTIDTPGVWLKESDGAWLHEQLAAGPVNIKLSVNATNEEFESHNVVGELPGADDEMVIIGSHHDGPWSSAVEDGSGISMVLAQAAYWSQVAEADRPHKLVFLLHGGHMSGGAGLHRYIADHDAELDSVVLEYHLEHAALEFEKDGDGVVSAGRPVPRWFFASEIPRLKEALFDALVAEDLRRSMILPPTAIGSQPPTDGGFYFNAGVPIVNYLAAPWYLFDKQDTLDKIDKDALVPLTRACIRVIESTKGVSAADMRAV